MGILDSFRLNGKVALVTGASRGLGQAMAVGLAEAGANIAVLDRTLDCNETCDLVKKAGRKFTTISCDLYSTPVSGLTDVVNTVVKELGSIDILVNNAGIIKRAPALEFSEDDWDAVLQINLKAVFFLSQAAARRMVPNGHGKIINIASMLSYQGGILVPSYTASKSGVMGITRALANEWASMGLNVNAIAPGYMSTENTAALRADETRNASILARIPAGRWGEANDLQGAVVFLASAASDYLNGAIIPVDGGWLAR
ncbi:MAG: 2-deoxy-D-gluconate 3-dehydrogenase [Chloroflexota bacterium]|nr:MAG: 2-deoxy-D-gluconate 3-dehydrogenase [Chloroflexota bacterium]